MTIPTTLILFTLSYPYDAATEQPFVGREIEYLAAGFDRVVIVPEKLRGKKDPVPSKVEVEESYGRILQKAPRMRELFLKALCSGLFFEELMTRPSILLKLSALKWLLEYIFQADLTRKWVTGFIKNNDLDINRCIFCTWWFVQSSLGIGLAKKDHPRIKLVSRTHGYDLYEERHDPAYIPCRARSLRGLDYLFPDAESGTKYIVRKYPWFVSKCETAKLGINDPGFLTASSGDKTFRIVSCSFMVPVKRIDLLLKGIEHAARSRPEQRFEWHHFGDGPLMNDIKQTADRTLPSSVKAHFPGYRSIGEIMLFYKNNAIDLFVNTSESEGVPLSIMEAASCGIPVIATAVGGNPEIVSERNGRLLSADPAPDEIAAAIFNILDEHAVALGKRKESRRIWEEKYCASRNYQAFVEKLKSFLWKNLEQHLF